MKKPLSTFSNNCNFTKNFSAILRGGEIVQFLGVHQTKLHLLYFEFWVMTLYISITYISTNHMVRFESESGFLVACRKYLIREEEKVD